MAYAVSGNPTTFITLTVRPTPYQTADERARALAGAWRAIVARALREARRNPKKRPYPAGLPYYKAVYEQTRKPIRPLVTLAEARLPYLAVVEATKRGEPHLHILSRLRWVDQKWLSRQASKLLGAPVVDVRRCTSRSSVALYVAKYIGKAPHRFATVKRYWSTRSWEQGKGKDKGRGGRDREGWKIVRLPLSELRTLLLYSKYRVVMDGELLVATPCNPSTGPPAWATELF